MRKDTSRGGFGSAVAEFYASCAQPVRLKIIGAENKFVPHATATQQAEECRLTAQDLARKIQGLFPHSKIFEKSQTEELMEEKRPSEKAGDVPQKN